MSKTIIKKYTLAKTLNFNGFHYDPIKAKDGIYEFEDTKHFKYALARILDTRKLIQSYKEK